MSGHQDLIDDCESKSPSSSHESGICSTMLAMDESLGSLEELSENLHSELNKLDTHIDHSALMEYEMDMLRAQLAEKNRLISAQQLTIKQLQESLNASHREVQELRRAAEAEINCKNETINILQSDLVECQQSYADCFEKVINQDRLLSEVREDDAILLQKITLLETQLRKTSRNSIGTQTETIGRTNLNRPTVRGMLFTSSPNQPTRSTSYQHSSNNEYQKSFYSPAAELSGVYCHSPSPARESAQYSLSSKASRPNLNTASEVKHPWNDQFQELVGEIRQIQQVLQSDRTNGSHRCPSSSRNEELTEFWSSITEERQLRLQLDHKIRQMELDFLEMKNQVQSCKARLQIQPQQHWNCCAANKLCSPPITHHCCSCADEIVHQRPPPATTLFTLV